MFLGMQDYLSLCKLNKFKIDEYQWILIPTTQYSLCNVQEYDINVIQFQLPIILILLVVKYGMINLSPGGCLIIKMSSYLHRNPHVKDKMLSPEIVPTVPIERNSVLLCENMWDIDILCLIYTAFLDAALCDWCCLSLLFCYRN